MNSITNLVATTAEHVPSITDQVMAWSTFALALFTAVMVGLTVWLVMDAKASSFRQIGVQTWLAMITLWDSKQMRRARKEAGEYFSVLHSPLKASKKPSASESDSIEQLLEFFENLGILYSENLIEPKLTDSTFCIYVCRWYRATEEYISNLREKEGYGETLYEHFESLAKSMTPHGKSFSGQTLHAFLIAEREIVIEK